LITYTWVRSPYKRIVETSCDVPEDWVIDHKNRNKLDNTRENLRWVSRSFNAWNAVRRDSAKMTSRWGDTADQQNGAKWRACALNKVTIGHFDTEREAAIGEGVCPHIRCVG
jgi:hypothetical protein